MSSPAQYGDMKTEKANAAKHTKLQQTPPLFVALDSFLILLPHCLLLRSVHFGAFSHPSELSL